MEEEKPTPMGAQAMGVSCIVPAYNEAQRIAEVLQTLEADRTLAEIIVVDDGSTDQTAAVVAPFVARDARFRLLRLPLNQGKAAAMVAGAACASSDVILFLDADLRGLRLDHLRALTEPVLRGECAMTLGRFVKPDGRADVAHAVSHLLTGERCLRWSLFCTAPGLLSARYGAETALNKHAHNERLATQTVSLVELAHCSKIAKRGWLGGLLLYYQMYRDIGLYWLRLAQSGRLAQRAGRTVLQVLRFRMRHIGGSGV